MADDENQEKKTEAKPGSETIRKTTEAGVERILRRAARENPNKK